MTRQHTPRSPHHSPRPTPPRTRWKRLASALSLIALMGASAQMSGCAGKELAPHKAPDLAADEGYVALAIYASQRLDHVQFVHQGPTRRGLSLYGEAGDGEPHLFRLRAGEYCLRSVTSRGTTAIDHDERSCFEVAPQMLNTPGALRIEHVPGPYPRVWTSWEPTSDHALRLIAARWPWLSAAGAWTATHPDRASSSS